MDNESSAKSGEEIRTFRIEQLFGSKTRARLLTLFVENSDRAFYVRELTRRIDAQLNSVRRELKNLVEVGIVSEVEGTILPEEKDNEEKTASFEKKKFYKANAAFPLFDDLRAVMRKASVLMNQDIVRVLKEKGDVSLVLLTGRFVDAPNVQTDVFIVGTVDPDVLAHAVREFERDIAREVNYTAMPKEEFLYRREVGDRFLANILEAKRVVLLNTIGEL